MKAGKKRHRLTFQAKTIPETVNSFGNPQEVWAESFDAWGAYEPANSREFPTAWKRYAEATARFRVDYDGRLMASNASDKYQIVMSFDETTSPIVSSTWNIFPPEPVDGKARELLIEAIEIKP